MRRRSGSMHWGINAFLVSAVVLAGLMALLWKSRSDPDRSPLFVYCAAGLKKPVEEIAQQFEREYGVTVQLTYGGSETLLTSAKVSGQGDLVISADYKYITQARSQDLIDEEIPLASMKPVVAVAKGNPKKIRTLQDLLSKDVQVAMANPEAAAIGLVVRDALQKTNRWDPLKKKSAFKGTEPLVATDVRLGTADAGIIWDTTAAQFGDKLDAVTIEELKHLSSTSNVAVLRSCKNPGSALRFARYLSARDQGLQVFAKHGFTPTVDGDLWADGDPIIHMHIGAMLRPAVERTIRDFEQREDLTPGNIRLNYNGCGVLVTQMKAGERPDAFFACDAKYLDDPLKNGDDDGKKIKDLYLDTTQISTNRLVLMVRKGNPKNILTLRDLTKKGMRIGVGDEHKCAMGALTAVTFRRGKIEKDVNIAVKSGTGDLLVNQMAAAPDELDAIVVYISNAKRVRNKFDVVEIYLDCAVAAQPIAAGKDSNHKQLVGRLIKALTSEESRKRFEENDFTWKAGK